MANPTLEAVVKFLADALQADLCEGGANKLNLTSIHHHDDQPMVSIETMSGELFTIVVTAY